MATRKIGVVLVALLVACGAAFGEGMSKGDREVAFSFAFIDVEDTTTIAFDVKMGYLLTGHNEVGATLSYMKLKDDEASIDSMGYGAFYHYNITPAKLVCPFLGVGVVAFGGDMGDYQDFQYGAGIGLKIYPYENAGITIGLEYSKITGPWDSEADSFSLVSGLTFKF